MRFPLFDHFAFASYFGCVFGYASPYGCYYGYVDGAVNYYRVVVAMVVIYDVALAPYSAPNCGLMFIIRFDGRSCVGYGDCAMKTNEPDVAKAYIAKGQYGWAFGIMVLRFATLALLGVCTSTALPKTITAASTAWTALHAPNATKAKAER
ncbi:hypothetical protein C8J45_105300 [Sphingomonas sp. PP-CE-3G-477]|uniref:hypothetical protein n=1 Tax=Sphingomonas sp. PP-CE-3G-477 TaxID=2135660 RepID=UPI000D37A353|nr:hypothetical protein [Sphingomonas sp. PP-CE-3G-477]PTQ63723.1 hypothetical protein C8J45_105300 [Sphingomonas sp. PP-CE-3G-477]